MAVTQSLTLTESNVSISSNTSTVRILWKSTQSGDSWNGYARTAHYYVSFDGGPETMYSVRYTLPKNATETILDTTITVAHNQDGTRSIKVRTWMDTDISAGVVEKTSTLALTTIARAASLDALSCSTAYFNGTFTYKYTPKSSSFYNKLFIHLNVDGEDILLTQTQLGQKGTSQQTATHTFSSTILSKIYNNLPNTKEGKLKFILFTYSNAEYSTKVGESQVKEITLTIPNISDTQPTATMTLTPVSSLASPFNSIYIKGKSKVKVSLTDGVGKYGATITSYKVSVSGKSGTPPFTSGYLTKMGGVTITGIVTDSRGYSRTYTKTITIVDYSSPKIIPISTENEVIAARCDSAGNLSDTGTYLKIKAKRSYTKVNVSGENKNLCYIAYRYKKEGGTFSSWTTILATTAASDEITTGALLNGALSVTSSYIVEVRAVDSIGEQGTTSLTLPTERVYMHRAGSIGSLGIGKYAEEENTVDIAEHITTKVRGNASFLGDADFEGGLKIQGSNLTDFVVEEGTKGIWTYRKWNSGIAECWGTSSVTSTFNKTWGALYVCEPTERQDYPFTFVARPVETVTMRNKGVGCFYYAESGNKGMNTTTQTAVYCATRPTSTVEQFVFYVDYHVSGRWK